jgi:transposase
MPKAFPEEFRCDVVAVARRRQAPMIRIAKDFGISESCLARWVKRAESTVRVSLARRIRAIRIVV